jgi:hypothetical protein
MADKMVQPEKQAKPVSGETDAALKSGGESGGDAYPNEAAKGRDQGAWQDHGGQSNMGYHGPGQLGDKEVGDRNQNAPAKSKD